MALDNTVNSILNKMHKQANPSDKGSYGEKAVFSICEDLYQRRGGILIHSYEYRTEDGEEGNIKYENGSHYVENTGTVTEIDVLLVTPYRIFPIEVKAYKSNTITLTNECITGCAITNKSPVHQNEMHMRHLYPKIFQALPDGMTKFIVPIVCFADKTKVIDKRTDDNKEYIHVTILNQMRAMLEQYDTPYNNTLLDLPAIELRLRSVMTSNEVFLPYIKK